MPTKQDAIEAAKTVQDPEIQVDIWTMGLVYDIEIKNKNEVHIKMTLTSPTCPYGTMLVEDFKEKLKKKGFKTVNIELVFEPIWQPSQELRMLLGV